MSDHRNGRQDVSHCKSVVDLMETLGYKSIAVQTHTPDDPKWGWLVIDSDGDWLGYKVLPDAAHKRVFFNLNVVHPGIGPSHLVTAYTMIAQMLEKGLDKRKDEPTTLNTNALVDVYPHSGSFS